LVDKRAAVKENCSEHDPEKCEAVFRKRSCSNKESNRAKTERNLQEFVPFAPCSAATVEAVLPDQTADTRPATGTDRFSICAFAWVGLLFLLFAASADLDRIFNLRWRLVPLVFIPALAVLVGWTAALIRNMTLRRWRRVISVLLAPVAAGALFVAADAAGVNAPRIRLEIGKRRYLDEIAKLAPTGEPRLKLFDWGQSGGAGVNSLIDTLVYDESDEILLPAKERSAAWQARAGKLCPGTPMCAMVWPLAEKSVVVKKIEGHFYLLTEIY
jgi:hypothetical protein